MLKKYSFTILSVFIGLSLVGCAVHKPLAEFLPVDLNPKVKSGALVQKTHNFLIILDASLTMEDKYKGKTKMELAKNFVNRFNKTIPDIKLKGGLRTLGDTSNPFINKTSLIYGLTRYSKAGLDNALNTILSGKGSTPLAAAINATAGDIGSTNGNIAVIIVSDGISTDGQPVMAAKNLKDQYGKRICIYTVLVGNDPVGRKNLKDIAKAGKCGIFSAEDEKIQSLSRDMSAFVEQVFFKPRPRPKKAKKVAAPPAPKIGKIKVPMDYDRDGVYDSVDKCPGTPLSARVDNDGCWMIGDVLFDTDKSNIKPEYQSMLNEVVSVMKVNPDLKIGIQGHTDSQGTAKYNRGLSIRRAKSVKFYLTEKGIDGKRLSTIGFGLTQPVASNLTAMGKTLNRRAQFNILQ